MNNVSKLIKLVVIYNFLSEQANSNILKMTSRVNCKYHPDANLIEDYRAGDTICGDCGMVVGDRYSCFFEILKLF